MRTLSTPLFLVVSAAILIPLLTLLTYIASVLVSVLVLP